MADVDESVGLIYQFSLHYCNNATDEITRNGISTHHGASAHFHQGSQYVHSQKIYELYFDVIGMSLGCFRIH